MATASIPHSNPKRQGEREWAGAGEGEGAREGEEKEQVEGQSENKAKEKENKIVRTIKGFSIPGGLP